MRSVVTLVALAVLASGCTKDTPTPLPTTTPTTGTTAPAPSPVPSGTWLAMDQLIDKLDVTLTAKEVKRLDPPPTRFSTWQDFINSSLGSMQQLWHALGTKAGVALTTTIEIYPFVGEELQTPCGSMELGAAAFFCAQNAVLYVPILSFVDALEQEIGVGLAYFAWGYHISPVEIVRKDVPMTADQGDLLVRCFTGVWAGTLAKHQRLAAGLNARWNSDRLGYIRATIKSKGFVDQSVADRAIDLGISSRNPGRCLAYVLDWAASNGGPPHAPSHAIHLDTVKNKQHKHNQGNYHHSNHADPK